MAHTITCFPRHAKSPNRKCPFYEKAHPVLNHDRHHVHFPLEEWGVVSHLKNVDQTMFILHEIVTCTAKLQVAMIKDMSLPT
jgi:hypothetical protein